MMVFAKTLVHKARSKKAVAMIAFNLQVALTR